MSATIATITLCLWWILYFAWSAHSYVHVRRWMCTITKTVGRSADNCYVRQLSHTLTGTVVYQFYDIHNFATQHNFRHDITNALHVVSGTSLQIYPKIWAASPFIVSVKLYACMCNVIYLYKSTPSTKTFHSIWQHERYDYHRTVTWFLLLLIIIIIL